MNDARIDISRIKGREGDGRLTEFCRMQETFLLDGLARRCERVSGVGGVRGQ